jgi:nicotinate-nucleotide pyrophosphorylase (carboxylating)
VKKAYLSKESINQFISQALTEDVGDGDHSSLGSIEPGKKGEAQLLIKDDGVLAGIELSKYIFNHIDNSLELEYFKNDGDLVQNGEVGLKVKGEMQSILKAERLVLNCMQRMSGIATKTYKLSELIADTQARLLDTRKTTPNFRIAEKWAVAIGGGTNHRFGLYDMVMLKDNHIDYAGGIELAINSTVQYLKKASLELEIEVETRNLAEVREVCRVGNIHTIMLDNMPPALMKEAVQYINGRFKTEASGGITEETIRAVALSGVDFISVGALTHSYKSLDISLKAVK